MRSRWLCATSLREGRGPVPLAGKIFGERLGRALGVDEDQHAFDRFGFQDPGQHLLFLVRADDHETLPNRIGRGGPLLDRDLGRVAQVALGDPADRIGHRGGEKRGLTLGRGLGEDPVDLFGEAHPQHFIGFVENQPAHAVELERTPAHVVDHPARRADDDVCAPIELPELDLVILAAVDRRDPHAGQAGGVAPEGRGDLDGQFAGRRQNDDLRRLLLQIDRLEHRHGERRRLAGAGLRLAEHIAALEQERDRPGLNRRGHRVARRPGSPRGAARSGSVVGT